MPIDQTDLIIPESLSLSSAMQQMDRIRHKLLIIVDRVYKFIGLITIGDIQRAIIAGNSLESPVSAFVRKDLVIARYSDDKDAIRQQMIRLRIEYMPVINDEHELIDIIFWDDIIDSDIRSPKQQLNLPVVVMAGGLGTRLRPLTHIIPKPLLPYGDKSILENIIERFRTYGCNRFWLSVNYKAEMIRFYLDSLHNKSFAVELFSEDKPLGTAGSLHLLKDQLKTTFFVSNCDILVDQDYAEIYNYHTQNSNELTIVVSVKQYSIPYGTVESGPNGELIALKEKPDVTFMVNCGMYILEPHLLDEIPAGTFFHLTDLITKIKTRGGKVGVFPISEKAWTDIGDWDLYLKLLNKKNI